ncbi:hypothetical protein WQ57_09695 [Mesobacillus campisalis]|uniref:Uncharacterized protein n=1 Tax=Mesobacillus campisalis TaxID=1408103 RepID=A0A0M2SU36_9BACI|nr:hypothetical protein WQ57_09695 [Mesobacillus campisalis]
MNMSGNSEAKHVWEQEQFLFKRELNRLLMEYKSCSNPFYKEQIHEEIGFLTAAIADYETTPFEK